MPSYFDTIESTEVVNIPPWNTTWPARDGCSTRYLYHTGRTSNGPTPSQGLYEPISKVTWREPRQYNGRAPRGSSIPYYVTPHNVSQTITRNHLLRRADGSNGYDVYQQYGDVHKVGGNCTAVPTSAPHSGSVSAKWNVVTNSHPYTEYVLDGFDEGEVTDAYRSVMDEASAEALNSYDVLTDLAQAREIPSLVRSVSLDLLKIMKAFSSGFKKSDLRMAAQFVPRLLTEHPFKVLREIGSRWLEYRYGIMPLVYSYRDAMKTLKRGTSVTTHKVKVIRSRSLGVTLPSDNTFYRWTSYVGDIRVKATVFQNFSWETVARLSGLGFNPLVTAWELIPYSFVVDWFVNVGNFIIRRTSSCHAEHILACVSIRRNYTKQTWAHFKNEDKTISFGVVTPVNWVGTTPPTPPNLVIHRPKEDQLLYEEETNAYSRTPFAPSDGRLDFCPNLNWRRLSDLASLALNHLACWMN